MNRSKALMAQINSIGYDPLCQILEVEFTREREIWRYEDVPESVWYGWREARDGVFYFRQYIEGRYRASRVDAGVKDLP